MTSFHPVFPAAHASTTACSRLRLKLAQIPEPPPLCIRRPDGREKAFLSKGAAAHPAGKIEQHWEPTVRLKYAVSHGDQCRLMDTILMGVEHVRRRQGRYTITAATAATATPAGDPVR